MCLCELEVKFQFFPQPHICLPVVGISLSTTYSVAQIYLPELPLFPLLRKFSSKQTFWSIKAEQIICQAGKCLQDYFTHLNSNSSLTLSTVTWDTRRRGGTDHLLEEAAGGGVVHQVVVPQINVHASESKESEWENSIGIVQGNQGARPMSSENPMEIEG